MEKRNQWLQEQKDAITPREYAMLEKASAILQGNICEGEAFPWAPYRCIKPFGWPDAAKGAGIWNWDSAFHALGVLHWDAALAKEQIVGFIRYQLDDGMYVDVVRADGKIEDCSSKPPVLAWAAAEIVKKDGDKEFAAEVYPSLAKNEAFWRTQRFYQGLFHYGANISKAPFAQLDQYVRWESGWDDSVRWDSPCADYWPIDLNCYGVMLYRGLQTLAASLGLEMDVALYKAREEELIANIRDRLWNDGAKIYADTNRFTGEPSAILTPASFMPLYIGIADKERAAYMARYGGDKAKFFPGMPTVAYDDPEYSQRYWRGNTWLNVAYFAAKGLKNYGYDAIADAIRDTILDWVERDGSCIHENYNSTTGEGLFCPKFSWSSVFVMEFILNF